MGAPRKDELAQAIYDRYCQGASIEDVATEFGRSRQSAWMMMRRRGWDLRPRPKAKPFVEWNGRRFTIRYNGYYGATDGDRENLHRLVWEANYGPVPRGMHVHHIDHDKTNNDPGNLEILSASEHQSHHLAIRYPK